MNGCSAIVLRVKQGTAALHNAVELPLSVLHITQDKDLQAVPFRSAVPGSSLSLDVGYLDIFRGFSQYT